MAAAARESGLGFPLTVAFAGVVVVSALLVLRMGGIVSFATDSLGASALAGAAFVAGLGAVRLSRAEAHRAARVARWLALMTLGYLGTAVWAVWADATDHPTTAAAVAVWGTAWIPILMCGQLMASSAIREREFVRPWPHLVLIVTVILAAVTNVLLVVPTTPFEGVPTIASESWHIRLAPLGLAVTALTACAFLLLPAVLWRAALTSAGAARARLGVAAAGASAAPLTITFCALLAVARDPGAVTPALGSVAFLVALAATTGFSTACAVLASRGAVEPRHLSLVVRGTGLIGSGCVVVALGTLVAAPVVGLGATLVAVIIAITTVLLVGAAWSATGLLTRVLLPGTAGTPTPVRVPGLTPREHEVLALTAEGASNAGIAEQLVVSKRTVDAHLRAIFTKLELGTAGPEINRRVQAARIWFDLAMPRDLGDSTEEDR